MLGAPVVKIELDDEQLKHCIESATKSIENLRNNSYKTFSDSRIEELTKQYALANSMIILGHIRGKHKMPQNEGLIGLDAKYLRNKGHRILDQIREEFSYNREEFMDVFLTLLANPENDPLSVKDLTLKIMGQIG